MRIRYRERYTALYNLADDLILEVKGMRTLNEMISYYKNMILNRG